MKGYSTYIRILSLAVSFCLIIGLCTPAGGSAVFSADKSSVYGDYAEDQILVVFDDDVNKKEAEEVVDQQDGKDLTVLDTPEEQIAGVVDLPKDQSVEEAVKDYQRDPQVAFAQPNYKYQLVDDGSGQNAQAQTVSTDLNDTYASDLWHLDAIGVQKAWELMENVNHNRVRVAVLDTGVDTSHSDLTDNLNSALCRDLSDGTDARALSGDDDGHGTHVSGIIAAASNNNIGVAGVASGKNKENSSVELFVVDVFDGEYAYTDAIVAGLQYAAQNDAKVVNMSLGYASEGEKNWEDQILEDSVKSVTDTGATVVCASGNDGNDIVNYPADFEDCISVIATTRNKIKAGYSNFGPEKDISAPGDWIQSTYPNNSYQKLSGTSMAAPVVAGTAALLYSIDNNLSSDQIKDILYRTASDVDPAGHDRNTGWGIVDTAKAVETALTQLNVPTGLKLSEQKMLTWDKVGGATGYDITIDSVQINTEPVTSEHYDLSGYLTSKESCIIGVRAAGGGKSSPEAIYSYHANKVNLITLSRSSVSLSSGYQYSNLIVPEISPSNATDKSVKWSSSSPGVAMVSQAGTVYAIGPGTTTITATARDGSGVKASCLVTVNQLVERISMSGRTMKKGSNAVLAAAVYPSSAANKNLSWSSSNGNVVSVDSYGRVKAKNSGRVSIRAAAQDGSGVSAVCQITVPYDITYKLNGGKNNRANPTSYYGKKITLKKPTRKGYAFSGWYKDRKYKKKITSFSSGSYTLYAKWKKVSVARESIKKLKKTSKTRIKVYYKKISGARGYQIAYTANRKFAKKKTKTVTASSSIKTLKKLKKGRTYYVRVRAYKTDSTGKRVYGKYSKVKKLKLTR